MQFAKLPFVQCSNALEPQLVLLAAAKTFNCKVWNVHMCLFNTDSCPFLSPPHCSRRNFRVKKNLPKNRLCSNMENEHTIIMTYRTKIFVENFWDIEFFQFWFITPCRSHSESYTNGFCVYFLVMQNVVKQQLVILKWYMLTFISNIVIQDLYWLANRCDNHITAFVWENEFKICQ